MKPLSEFLGESVDNKRGKSRKSINEQSRKFVQKNETTLDKLMNWYSGMSLHNMSFVTWSNEVCPNLCINGELLDGEPRAIVQKHFTAFDQASMNRLTVMTYLDQYGTYEIEFSLDDPSIVYSLSGVNPPFEDN